MWSALFHLCDLLVPLFSSAKFWVATILIIVAWILGVFGPTVPQVRVATNPEETDAVLVGCKKFDPSRPPNPRVVECWDPCTLDHLGSFPAMTPEQVGDRIALARAAQETWRKSSFEKRRLVLRVLQRFIVENTKTIATVACRDGGKTPLDAMFGEVNVTLEKLRWTIAHGEKWLLPEYRDSGLMNLHKTSRVEYHPVGVVGAIVPWNYPFHNVFNPAIAALFSGNAIVIKVSEYASWSHLYYKRVFDACLEAAGAPRDLVQFVIGYGETGNALVTGGVDKVIFVGSVGVGKLVMQAACRNLTPVILELGGKDPFIICDDVNISENIVQLATRGVFQNMGQNCAGPERFLVHERVYDEFCTRVTALVKQLKQGPTLASDVDCGALCMPKHHLFMQKLVDDVVAKGGRVLAGGFIPPESSPLARGQFYPPTIVADVTENMLIAKEEIFGPIMCIMKIRNDAEAIQIANNCDFGLSSCVFSSDPARASRIGRQLQAGMLALNDLEGTSYLSQSLPFGGVKQSGFGNFAGPEGLRGLCNPKSIVENRFSWMSPSIPPAIAYPANGQGPAFVEALNQIFYGYGLRQKLAGVLAIIAASRPKPSK